MVPAVVGYAVREAFTDAGEETCRTRDLCGAIRCLSGVGESLLLLRTALRLLPIFLALFRQLRSR